MAAMALVGSMFSLKNYEDEQAVNTGGIATASTNLAPKKIAQTENSFFENNNGTSTATSTKSATLASIESSVINSISQTPVKVITNNIAKGLGVSAYAYLVGNINTGQVVLSSRPNIALPVASMSKLVTSVAALYSLSSTSTIEITKAEAALPPDGSNLTAGEKFLPGELLYPMLVASSNVAAEALASAMNRQKFLELMSGYAWEIGMPQTYFADASGIDPHDVASAFNVFALARYLYNYHPDILAITRNPIMEIASTSEHAAHTFESTHPFVNDPRFIGGKTGRTPQAGETMLTILKIDNQPIAFIVLGSKIGARESDTKTLISEYQKKIIASR